MRGVIAVTDDEWFEFLRRQRGLDEVNFWRPSDTRTPRQLQPGMPFIFKLKKKRGDAIVGYGVFARHSVASAWYAWDAFRERNGAPTFDAFCAQLAEHRRLSPEAARTGSFEIGCIMLSSPVFLESDRWIRPPADWQQNIVQDKGYDLATGEGARIWKELVVAASYARIPSAIAPAVEAPPAYGDSVLFRPRLGQGTFRLAVADAYGKACAVTGEHSLPALEAAHIRPYADSESHDVSNGLFLRSDIHRLYDAGYVGVRPDHVFVVSKRLKDDYSNGRSYYPLDGRTIHLPAARADRPNVESLVWHMDARFRR